MYHLLGLIFNPSKTRSKVHTPVYLVISLHEKLSEIFMKTGCSNRSLKSCIYSHFSGRKTGRISKRSLTPAMCPSRFIYTNTDVCEFLHVGGREEDEEFQQYLDRAGQNYPGYFSEHVQPVRTYSIALWVLSKCWQILMTFKTSG